MLAIKILIIYTDSKKIIKNGSKLKNTLS